MWTLMCRRSLLESFRLVRVCDKCPNLKKFLRLRNGFSGSVTISFTSNKTTYSVLNPKPHVEIKNTKNSNENLDTVMKFIAQKKDLHATYGWILELNQELLQSIHKNISAMKFKDIAHSLPFYRLSLRNLLMILCRMKLDYKQHKCENRLYYMSSRLECDPAVLSENLCKRIFVFKIDFDWLRKSLDVLLEMGIPPHRIVKDLWVLKYDPEKVKTRLELVRATGRTELAPWMVRCTESIFNRSLEISNFEKSVLGENSSMRDYLVERLNTTPDVVRDLCERMPYIRHLSIAKAKKYLDFLFSQGYTEEDILRTPRVLAHSQQTIEMRLSQLEAIGIHNPKNLNLICKSKKEFEYSLLKLSSDKGNKQDGKKKRNADVKIVETKI